MRVTLIHNPSAGDAQCTRGDLLDLLSGAGHVSVQYATRDDWREALADPGELVVAAGGDGTVVKVAGALVGRGVPLAILPLGTANNVATQLGWGEDLEAIVAGWSAMRRAPFDIGTCQTGSQHRWFLESVGCGLFASAMMPAPSDPPSAGSRGERLERDRRALRAHLEVCVPRPRRVALDGTDHSGEYLSIEVLNFGLLGPRLRLAAQAQPQDGRLHVALVSERDRAELHAHLGRSSSQPWSPPRLEVLPAQRVELECEACDLHVDGKIASALREWGEPEGPIALAVGLQPGAVELLLPAP